MGDENADLTRPPPHLEGVLLKQDPRAIMRGWKSRYFVVRKDNIFYYKTKEESVANQKYTGAIKLPEVEEINETTFSKVPKPSYVNCGFTLTISGHDRVYSLLAESAEECDRWVRGLKYIKMYWSAQNVYRTTVINDEEITRRMRADEDEEDYIDSMFTVYGGDGDSKDSPRQRRSSHARSRTTSMPKSSASVSRVMVHLTGGDTKRVALPVDGTAETLLGLLASSLMSSSYAVWQVSKAGTVRRLAMTEAIAPLKPNTERFFCLSRPCRPLVVHFGSDDSFVMTDVPDTVKAYQVVELKCMTDRLAQLGIHNAGLFLRDMSNKDILFANEDMPCKLLFDDDPDGLPCRKANIGHLVMHNKRQFDSPSLRPSHKTSVRVAAEEKRKREKDASLEDKQRSLLDKIDQQRQLQLMRNEQRRAEAAAQAAAEQEDSDNSGDFFTSEKESSGRSLSISLRKRKPKPAKNPEDTPFEMVSDFFTGGDTAMTARDIADSASGSGGGGDMRISVTEASLMSPPSEGSEREFTPGSLSSESSLASRVSDSTDSRDDAAAPSVPGARDDSEDAAAAAGSDTASNAAPPSAAAAAEESALPRPASQSPDSAAVLAGAARSAMHHRGSVVGGGAKTNRVRFSTDVMMSADVPSDPDLRSDEHSDGADEEDGMGTDDARCEAVTSVSSTAATDDSSSATSMQSGDSDSDSGDEWHRMQDDDLNDLVSKPLDSTQKEAIKGVLSRHSILNLSRRNQGSRKSFGDFDEKHSHILQQMESSKNKPAAAAASDDLWQVVSADSFDSKAAAEAARKSVRRHTILNMEAPTPAQAAGAAVGLATALADNAASASARRPGGGGGSGEKRLARQRSVHVTKKRAMSVDSPQQGSSSASPSPDLGKEDAIDGEQISEDTLVAESRSIGFGDRPMLTLNDVHEHNQEMERITALLDRQQQVEKDHEEKERKMETIDPDRQIESLQAKLQALQKGKTGNAPIKAHHPLPVDISRLLPQLGDEQIIVTVTPGHAFPITNPARLKSAIMQAKHGRDSTHKTYSRQMDFISLSGTLLRNTGGQWHLETGSRFHEEMDEETDDHLEMFRMPGGVRATYNHTQKSWCVRPSGKAPVPVIAMPAEVQPASPSSPSSPSPQSVPVAASVSTAGNAGAKPLVAMPVLGKPSSNGPPVTAQPVAVPTKAAETAVETRTHAAAVVSEETLNTYAMKERLVKGILGSTEHLLSHFSATREADKKCILGDDARTPDVGHFVRGAFCTSIAAMMANGLRPTRLGGLIVHSLWDVAAAASSSSSSLASQPAQQAVELIKSHPLMADSNMKYRTFVCLALTNRFLEPWLDHLRNQDDVIRKYYYADAFLAQGRGQCAGLYDTLLLAIQPLAELPFKLHVAFEGQQSRAAEDARQQERQLQRRHTAETMTDGARPGSEAPVGLQHRSSLPVTFTAFVDGSGIGKRGASPLVVGTPSVNGSMDALPRSSAEASSREGTHGSQASGFSTKMFSRFKQVVASIQNEYEADTEEPSDGFSRDEPAPVSLDALKQRLTAVRQKSKQAIVGLKMKLAEPETQVHMEEEETDSAPRLVRALYTNMTDDDDELEFNKDDILVVIEEVNEEWLLCGHGDHQGLVPTNYVESFHE